MVHSIVFVSQFFCFPKEKIFSIFQEIFKKWNFRIFTGYDIFITWDSQVRSIASNPTQPNILFVGFNNGDVRLLIDSDWSDSHTGHRKSSTNFEIRKKCRISIFFRTEDLYFQKFEIFNEDFSYRKLVFLLILKFFLQTFDLPTNQKFSI